MPDSQLPPSADLWVVLGCFVVVCLVLHVGLLRVRSARFWITIDYIWLGAAILGLAGSVRAVHDYAASTALKSQEGLVESEYRSVSWDIDHLLRSPPGDAFTQDRWSGVQSILEGMLAYYAGDEPAEDLVRSGLIADLGGTYHGVKAPYRVRELLTNLEALRHQVERMQSWRQELEHSAVYGLFLGLAPFVLAAALALRVTKVSANLRRTPERSPPNEPDADGSDSDSAMAPTSPTG